MKAIDALLPEQDGLKWFNRMYLMVTENVNAKPPGGAWQNPAWLERLDVVFAGFYFDALADFLAGRETAASWRALFAARFTHGIDRIQYAIAGNERAHQPRSRPGAAENRRGPECRPARPMDRNIAISNR